MHGRGIGRAGRGLAQLTATGKNTNKQPAEQQKQAEARSSRIAPPGLLAPLQRERISTVVDDTKIDETGKVTDAGHIQYQTSDAERERDPALARAIGHARRVDIHAPKPQRFKVSGKLPDGKPFSVGALKGPAITSGEDKIIDRGHASRVIDHGEMTDEQIEQMKTVQKQAIFPDYETSGRDQSNCVHAHAEVARTVFGWDVQPERHARPQDLGQQMTRFRTDHSGKGKSVMTDTPSEEADETERSGSDSERSD